MATTLNQFPICDIEPTSGIGRIGHRQFEITTNSMAIFEYIHLNTYKLKYQKIRAKNM